jgi:CubicO group peptidase (beta-lactamase class C family)
LRISARDLAKVGRLLLNQGEVDGVRLLSPASVQALTQVQWKYNGGNGMTSEEDDSGQGGRGFVCRYALAVQHLATAQPGCHDDPFGDGRQRIGHSGSAYGLLSGLWIDPQRGEGVVYFVTGMPDAREGGHSAFSVIEETMAQGKGLPSAKDAPQVRQ